MGRRQLGDERGSFVQDRGHLGGLGYRGTVFGSSFTSGSFFPDSNQTLAGRHFFQAWHASILDAIAARNREPPVITCRREDFQAEQGGVVFRSQRDVATK